MSSPEAEMAGGDASPSGDNPKEAPEADESLLRKFRHHEILEKLKTPEERHMLVQMMRAFEGPDESEEEDGRGLYHDALCLLRYCRARKWNFQAAHDMLRNTGKWRRSFNFAGLIAGEYVASVASENESGKLYVRGFDRRGWPVVYIRPRNENSTDNQAQVRHLAYCVERAVRCIDRQVEEGRLKFELTDPSAGKFILCVDFGDYGLSNLIPLSVARATISILQDHYPERLGQAFIVDAPWILNAFFSAVTPFIDPVTQEKFQFVTDVGQARSDRFAKTFDLSELEPEFGGTAQSLFESHVFLHVKRDGTEFGLEFNEQLAISEEENQKAKLNALQECSAKASFEGRLGGAMLVAPPSFWGVSSDTRVLSLARKERGLVRELARVLSCHRDDAREEHEGLFDDAGALIRYLRAQAWSPLKAEAKIRATARWRKGFGLAAQREGALREALAGEAAVGKMYVRGFDRRGRPVLYVKLNRRGSRRDDDSIRYFVYCVERAVACVDQRLNVPVKVPRSFGPDETESDGGFQSADGKFVLLIDFAGYSSSHRPKMWTVREAMAILQDHYPERLGDAYLLSPPLKVCALWRLFRRMVDPSLYQRVTLVRDAKSRAELMSTVFDRLTMERSVGGEVDSRFDPHIFLNRQVNGEVYGAEFEAQFSASGSGGGGAHASSRRVSWADNLNMPLKEENEETYTGWTFSLESLFGGSNSSLW